MGLLRSLREGECRIQETEDLSSSEMIPPSLRIWRIGTEKKEQGYVALDHAECKKASTPESFSHKITLLSVFSHSDLLPLNRPLLSLNFIRRNNGMFQQNNNNKLIKLSALSAPDLTNEWGRMAEVWMRAEVVCHSSLHCLLGTDIYLNHCGWSLSECTRDWLLYMIYLLWTSGWPCSFSWKDSRPVIKRLISSSLRVSLFFVYILRETQGGIITVSHPQLRVSW